MRRTLSRRSLAILEPVPFPLLAHQAPVLPLKARWPRAFNATALVVGSIAPDLENFSSGVARSGFGHTLRGQITFCLPVTLGVVLLVGHLRLGETLAARFGKCLTWLADAATDVTRPGGLRRAVVSALFGSFSHLALDALTHEAPTRVSHATYHVAHLMFSLHAVAQLVASVIGALVSLWILRRMYLQNTREPPPHRPGAIVVVAAALAGGAFGLHRARPAIGHPDWYFEAGRVYVWGYTLFLVVAAASAGILLAAVALALFDRTRQPS